MYDQHAGLSLDGCDPGYTLEDVDACFGPGGFETLKYSQTFYLPADGDEGGDSNQSSKGKKLGASSRTSGKLLAVTPHRSGRVSGGCYWVLRRLVDDTEIVLAPTYGVGRERHLAGSTLHRFGTSADALVTCPGGPRGALGGLYRPGDGGRPARLPPPSSSRSEAELVESVMTTLRRDGNVLFARGRVRSRPRAPPHPRPSLGAQPARGSLQPGVGRSHGPQHGGVRPVPARVDGRAARGPVRRPAGPSTRPSERDHLLVLVRGREGRRGRQPVVRPGERDGARPRPGEGPPPPVGSNPDNLV
ncbi:hypothetical protein THAOC_13787, partial [Thalassiosira oceanica]